ncbi:dihydrofolate reductase [Klebsiella pneumoniae]|uniref:dihydrofolate reductase n=1 Tax=Klebsiella pneumoniae TaxID=573 RepID=UPI003F6E4196
MRSVEETNSPRCPSELKLFRELTTNATVVMGRKTMEVEAPASGAPQRRSNALIWVHAQWFLPCHYGRCNAA